MISLVETCLFVVNLRDQVNAQNSTSASVYRLTRAFKLLAALVCAAIIAPAAAEAPLISVGVAQVDITPDYPVRLSGFGFRRVESEGITDSIWAKARSEERRVGEECSS